MSKTDADYAKESKELKDKVASLTKFMGEVERLREEIDQEFRLSVVHNSLSSAYSGLRNERDQLIQSLGFLVAQQEGLIR